MNTRAPLSTALRLLAALAALSSLAAAQPDFGVPQVPPEYVDPFRRVSGDTIKVCVNSESVLRDLEVDVARAVGQALLLNVDIVLFEGRRAPPILDYTLGINESELFILLSNDCHALSGFLLSETRQVSWLTVSRPYAELTFAVATRLPGVTALADLPAGASIATRIGTSADIALQQHLDTLPTERRWRRVPYPNNRLALDKLLEGEMDAALLWEPAVFLGTDGDPTAAGLTLLDPRPLRVPTQRFGYALLNSDSFLRTALDEAIAQLAAEGVIDALLAAHGVPGRAAQ